MLAYDLVIALECDPDLINRLSFNQCVQVIAALAPDLIDPLESAIDQYDMTPDEALRHAQEGVRAALENRGCEFY